MFAFVQVVVKLFGVLVGLQSSVVYWLQLAGVEPLSEVCRSLAKDCSVY